MENAASVGIDTTDLRTLIDHNCWIHGDLKLEAVYEEFRQHSHEFMAVLDDDRCVLGLSSREELGMLLSIRYGRELFARKPVREHLSRPATIVRVGDRVSSVLQDALGRAESYFFEDVVLVDGDRKYLGLIAMQTLIRLQHRLLSETILGLESQSLEINARQREMEEELRLANRLQQAMFHNQSQQFTSPLSDISRPYKLYYHYQPASLVGGDYFHSFELAEGVIGIMVCDVMGHGVRSALVTAMMRALAETHIRVAGDPGVFLCRLNRDLTSLLSQVEDSLFVTAQYLLVDSGAGEVRYAIAGHHEPLVLKRDCRLLVPLFDGSDLVGPPLGILEDAVYGTGSFSLVDGDLFLLYTDGLFEVFSPDGEMYGHPRLMETVREKCHLPVPAMFLAVIEELGRFAGGARFTDDICIVGLDVHLGH
jgi:serine phosphatase RsbU (regulator of sigma subunit)